MANRDVMAGLLGGLAGTAPQWGGALGKRVIERREVAGMSDLAKLQALANPRDIADIESLAKLLPELTAADRERAIEKVKKRIGVESVPLLEHYIRQTGEAPALGLETWRMGGKPAPAAARTRLEQLRTGTQPGFEAELRLGQLPEEARIGEWAKRAKRAEPTFPGITEVGRGMMPKGIEGVLPPTEATRQRAREAGQWPGLTAITGEWDPAMLAEEKEETIRIAEAKGLLDKYGVAAAKTFIDKERLPSYLTTVPESMWSQIGIKKEAGVAVNSLSTKGVEAVSQLNLRSVFSVPKPTLAELHRNPNIDRIRQVVFGPEQLSEPEIKRIDEGESTLPSWLVQFIRDPIITKNPWSDEWLATIKKLLRFFAPQDVAAILTLAHDESIREGWMAQYGMAEGVK